MTSRVWWAQCKEDKIAARIFRRIGTTNQVAVDIGAMDGLHGSNTAHFRRIKGWTAHLFDAAPLDPLVEQADVTAENVNRILQAKGVPFEFDLLSIDIDGNDLWVWQALDYRPRVVIVEYNPRWGPRKSRTVPYDPLRRWDRTNYYGASVRALVRLGKRKGYDLAAATRSNLIFVEAGLIEPMAYQDVIRSKKQKRPDPLKRKWVAYA